MLAHEATAVANDSASSAPGRVYDKLHAHLAPLVGTSGVEALFARSAKLVRGDFVWASEVSILEATPRLREQLHGRDAPLANESAVALFGTFFTLITTFIGERLTTQLLASAWPSIDETPPEEAK